MGKRIASFVRKQVKKEVKKQVKKARKKGIEPSKRITEADIKSAAEKSGYEGKITPYIRKKLVAQIKKERGY